MTDVEFNPAIRGFLSAFFGPGNLLAWSSVETRLQAGNLDQALFPWLERLARSPNGATLLPRPIDGGTVWYGLGHTFAQSEQLREELLAAVGPTYSDFVGHRAELDADDPVERAVLEFTQGHAFRMRVPAVHRDSARASLDRLRRLWEQRPPHVGIVVRSIGRVLRDFELALAVRDLAEGRARLDELRAGGMLDARNVLFQEIRLLAAGERWSEIMTLNALPDLAQVRCPVVVADAVLCAIYAVEFAAFEDGDGPAAAVARFRDHALGRWSSFFRVKSTIRSPAALKLFMMLAVSTKPPRLELRDAVLAEPTLTGRDRAYCDALAALEAPLVSEPPADALSVARARHDAGDYDGAFPAALAAAPSAERIQLLLNCAVELSRLEATAALLEAFDLAPVAMREEVLASSRCRVLWQHLVGTTSPAGVVDVAPPANWLGWLERLTGQAAWPDALEVAEQGAREWDPVEFLRDGEAIERFRTMLAKRTARTDRAQTVLRDAVPYLIGFLTEDRDLLRRGRGVLEDLLLLLTDEDDVGAADMGAIKEVVAALIDLGPSAGEYRELVAFLRSTWERFGAPRRIDWLLEAFETLTVCPAPAPEARDVFAETVFAAFAKWRNHIEAAQWRLLTVLCENVGLESALAAFAPAKDDVSPPRALAEALDGRTVVIHSLMERSAKQARDVLEATCDVKVVLNSDHVATPQLRELAKRVDLFVVVWRAAKHAATGCIEATRPKDLPLLRPDGRSATAILRAIVDWCQRDQA